MEGNLPVKVGENGTYCIHVDLKHRIYRKLWLTLKLMYEVEVTTLLPHPKRHNED